MTEGSSVPMDQKNWVETTTHGNPVTYTLTHQKWRCSKGHESEKIGLTFATMDGVPVKRYCYVCLTEALEGLGVQQVEMA